MAAVKIQYGAVVGGDLHQIHRQQHRADADRHNAQAEHTADKAEDHTGDAAAAFWFFLFLGRGSAVCRGCFCAGGRKLAFLIGFYGNRLLLEL